MNKINYNYQNIFDGDLKLFLYRFLKDSEKSNQIITLNLDNFRDAHYDKEYLSAVKKALCVTIDGMGLKLLLKLKFGFSHKVITGTDIFITLLEIANEKKLNIGLIGASVEVKEIVEKKINMMFPNVMIELKCTPESSFENDFELNRQIINEIHNSNSDIIFVALGSPRQEKWVYDILPKINTKIIIGIGSVFDTYSEEIKRAPVIFQKAGFEWLWRLVLEPKRMFNRYIIKDIPFFFRFLLSDAKN